MLTDARSVKIRDVIRRGAGDRPWTVTVVHHIGGTVHLTLRADDGETIDIVRDGRERVHVAERAIPGHDEAAPPSEEDGA